MGFKAHKKGHLTSERICEDGLKPLEADIQKSILDYLSIQGVLAWRVPLSASLYSPGKGEAPIHRKNPLAGFPDIAGVLPGGRLLAIEVKRPGGKLSELQRAWLTKLAAAGAAAAVIRSLDEAKEFLAHVMREC